MDSVPFGRVIGAQKYTVNYLTGCLIKWGVTFTARAGLGGVYCEKCTGQQINWRLEIRK